MRRGRGMILSRRVLARYPVPYRARQEFKGGEESGASPDRPDCSGPGSGRLWATPVAVSRGMDGGFAVATPSEKQPSGGQCPSRAVSLRRHLAVTLPFRG